MALIKPMSKKMEDKDAVMMTEGPKNLASAMAASKKKPSKKMPESEPVKAKSGTVASIMEKRKMMAEGGSVTDSDTDASNLEQPNMMDELNESALKENYSEAPEMDPADAQDMISAIRSKMSAKRIFR